MIEIRNLSGSKIHGCCPNMKAAHTVLSGLVECGMIPAGVSVTLRHYKNRICQKVSEVRYSAGKWRPVNRDARGNILPRVVPVA